MVANVAAARAELGGGAVAVPSNAATFTVAERLDAALAPGPSGADQVSALLVNRGNGAEAFQLSVAVPEGVSVAQVAVDVDGDGRFDPAVDAPLAAGTTPALEPGAELHLVLVLAGTAQGADPAVTLVARAATGSGAPGTVFAGRGDGGGDAVAGPTGGEATLRLPLATADAASPALAKSQAVLAPDGTAAAVPGARVTYTLRATFPAARRAARIEDAVPAGTAYVPGSLLLDGTPLTDAADGDAGSAGAGTVAVALGDVPAGAARTVQFQVTLQ